MSATVKNDSQYISGQVQRTLKVMSVMAGREVQGISPSELAKLAQTSPANITRILANLKQAQFAERLPSDSSRWRLAPKLVQIANSVSLNLNQAQLQLQQDQQNYSLLAI
ncbi:MarR family transcriptional regulator [Shewanella eurypsychrophilus]|uniref:MarR family transcriptional regulator n=1 Tax=Shewanella eurypsychrophilus TaxID=2593656 RepID=A0ABX6VBQ9_9GAMM|nr:MULTISPECIES: MarR family transcriptional regulator [Shewanella]QFU23761.1 MarR family transcriptional regulator [Shewanella sp. YLB-09]QPG58984.1 MarR family transcriptional regulator [Shewanella eurypsychrophilus]